jgi:ATP/ADP translocase
MSDKRLRILDVRPGEWGLLISLLLLLAINTMVLQITNVVATTGFVSQVGMAQIPLLWIVDMIITLISAGAYALIVDRVARLRLVSWLLVGFALCYLVIQLLFTAGAPKGLTYPLLYVLSDQQYVIFPLAFWSLANDVYAMAESKRLFPMIAAGAALGSILGNGAAAGAAAIFSGQEQSTSRLLLVGVGVFFIGLVLLRLTFRRREVRARQSKEATGVRETVRVGVDVIRNVPLFSYLAVAMLLVGLAFTVIEYHFLFTIDRAFTGAPLKFQAFYGLYNAALIVTTWLIQWLVTGRLLKRIELRSAFILLPVALIVASGGAFILPGLVGGVGAVFLGRLMQKSWDEPSRKSAQGLIPDERRGRVSTFLDSYFYALSTIVGCLILSGLLLAASLGWLPERVVVAIYLILAALAAAGAVWMALRIRATYDKSLLNWRLARSRRKSVLDGIEF